jgi:hypothetical protein
MNELYVSEDYICIDGEKRFSGGGIDAPYLTRYTTTGELYRACVRQHGRCVSKEYIDIAGKAVQVGWVFYRKAVSKDRYDMEVWITVFKTPPTKRTVYEGAEYPTFRSKKHHESAP